MEGEGRGNKMEGKGREGELEEHDGKGGEGKMY